MAQIGEHLAEHIINIKVTTTKQHEKILSILAHTAHIGIEASKIVNNEITH